MSPYFTEKVLHPTTEYTYYFYYRICVLRLFFFMSTGNLVDLLIVFTSNTQTYAQMFPSG